MATRTGQKIQNQWTEDEVEDLLVLMDKLGGSLPMKKLEALQDKEQPEEAYPPSRGSLRVKGMGEPPAPLGASRARLRSLFLSEKRRRGRRRSRRRGRRRRGRSRSRGGR